MHITDFLITILIGIFMYLVVIWATFTDFAGVILKLFPLKTPSGYETLKRIKTHTIYKKHKKKWIRFYLLTILTFVVSYTILALIINSGVAFLLAVILSVICFGIVGNFEIKQRKIIEQKIIEEIEDIVI